MSDNTKQLILERADIIDIVSQYVRLQQRGGRFFGLCPFHTEKTPSFSVNPEQGYYHCFGCQKGGNVIDFIIEVENLTFIEAMRFLATRLNIPMEAPSSQNRKHKEIDRYEVMEKAAIIYQRWLDDHDQAKKYLLNRGLKPDHLQQFGLGYVPDGWDHLRNAMQRHQYPIEVLLELGLVAASNKSNGYYDRFRNRIIFPIRNTLGRIIAFGGRAMDPNDNAKYLNSPDTPLFNKSKVLYMLDKAKTEFKEHGAILVEGYMDVIALHIHGFNNAVASLGTAITPEHVKVLQRYTDNFTLLYDADNAGINAAKKGVEICLGVGISPKVVLLPDGQDPDDFLKSNGQDAMKQLITDSHFGFTFYLNQVIKKYNINLPTGKVNVAKEMAPLMAVIPDRMIRHDYLNELAAKIGAQVDDLKQTLKQNIRKNNNAPQEQSSPTIIHTEKNSPVTLVKESLIRMLAFHQGYLIPENLPANQKPTLFTEEELLETIPQALSLLKDQSALDMLLGTLLNDVKNNVRGASNTEQPNAVQLDRLFNKPENRTKFYSITEREPLPNTEKELRKLHDEIMHELQVLSRKYSYETLKRQGDLEALNQLIWAQKQDNTKTSFF